VELVDEHARVIEMLTDKDPATGDYKIPRIIYCDAYASEMVAYADLILPDTTYLERTTASRCSTGRSAMPTVSPMRSASP
jgi:anaerobic selenocysteine-containing dehydrogenase